MIVMKFTNMTAAIMRIQLVWCCWIQQCFCQSFLDCNFAGSTIAGLDEKVAYSTVSHTLVHVFCDTYNRGFRCNIGAWLHSDFGDVEYRAIRCPPLLRYRFWSKNKLARSHQIAVHTLSAVNTCMYRLHSIFVETLCWFTDNTAGRTDSAHHLVLVLTAHARFIYHLFIYLFIYVFVHLFIMHVISFCFVLLLLCDFTFKGSIGYKMIL